MPIHMVFCCLFPPYTTRQHAFLCTVAMSHKEFLDNKKHLLIQASVLENAMKETFCIYLSYDEAPTVECTILTLPFSSYEREDICLKY